MKRDGKYRLKTCVWELTLACTYSCWHCGSHAGRRREGELTTAEALDVAAQLIDVGCERVIMIGGEVFLRVDWDVIARRLTNEGVEVSVITNGACFSDENWMRLRAAGVGYLGISIDGMKKSHDAMRVPGGFDIAMGAIEKSKSRGFQIAVITVVTSNNVEDIPLLYDVLDAKGVDVWQLQLCSPFGNAGHSKGIVPPVESIAALVRLIANWAEKVEAGEKHMNVVAADNIGYFTRDETLIRGHRGGSFPGCAAGLSVIGIDSIGNVRGCESLYDDCFVEGNLRERSLASIWDDKDAFAYNRRFDAALLAGECGDCAEGYRCAGGCRSINHFLAGNMYDSHTCIRQASSQCEIFAPEHGDELSK